MYGGQREKATKLGKKHKELGGMCPQNKDSKILKQKNSQLGDRKVLEMQSKEKGLCKLLENQVLGL